MRRPCLIPAPSTQHRRPDAVIHGIRGSCSATFSSLFDGVGHELTYRLSRQSGYCYYAEHQETGANMRSLIWTVSVLVAFAISRDALAQSAGPFDGKWTTVVSCPAAEGAGSFTILVDADVKGGVFSGEKGDNGKPGWYSLNGKVQSDGAVEIFARGIVPSSRLAAGNVPVGTAYGYPITGRLEGTKGTGARRGGRHCSVTFTKQ